MIESLWIDAEETDSNGVAISLNDLGSLLLNHNNPGCDYIKTAARLFLQWDHAHDPSGILAIFGEIMKLPESRLRTHVQAALEVFVKRWTVLHQYGLLAI